MCGNIQRMSRNTKRQELKNKRFFSFVRRAPAWAEFSSSFTLLQRVTGWDESDMYIYIYVCRSIYIYIN